jgi:hypothetical protein
VQLFRGRPRGRDRNVESLAGLTPCITIVTTPSTSGTDIATTVPVRQSRLMQLTASMGELFGVGALRVRRACRATAFRWAPSARCERRHLSRAPS